MVNVANVIKAEKANACPFCGGKDIIFEHYKHPNGHLRWRILCTSCMAGIDPGWVKDKNDLLVKWNQRISYVIGDMLIWGGVAYEVVDHIPAGYQIWNIGEHMKEGWLPLCKLKEEQRIDDGMEIDPDTLKAIWIGERYAELLLYNSCVYGFDTFKKADDYMEKYAGTNETNTSKYGASKVTASILRNYV